MISGMKNITDILPQKAPFVFVDEVVGYDVSSAVTRFTVTAGHPLVEDGRLTLGGMLENMAQTMAAHAALSCDGTPRVGVIAAVPQMTIHGRPAVGETLTTDVRILESVFGMVLSEAVITVNGQIIATAKLKTKTEI